MDRQGRRIVRPPPLTSDDRRADGRGPSGGAPGPDGSEPAPDGTRDPGAAPAAAGPRPAAGGPASAHGSQQARRPVTVISRRTHGWALVFAALAVTHLSAQLAGAGTVAMYTQFLLMPALAAAFWAAGTGGGPVLLALGFSWLGDSVPALLAGDTRFLAMVGLFLCAQVTYIVAFWPGRRRSVLRRPALLGYVVAFGVLLALCAPGAGGLLVPVVVYGLCLALMAVLATGVHPLAAAGGAIFFVSDGLIALDAFAKWYAPPVPGFWVMLTYVTGQALIVAGVVAARRGTGAITDTATATGQ